MKFIIIHFCLPLILISITSCGQKQQNKLLQASEGQEMIIEKSSRKEFALNDSLSFLGTEALYRIIGKDSGIVKDASLKLSLYVNHRCIRTIGKLGKGDAEYASADDTDFYKDTLFILDNTNAKILGYSLTSGECVYQLPISGIAHYGITSLVRFNGVFVLGNCRYVPPAFQDANNVSKDVKGSENLFMIMDNKGVFKTIGPKRTEIEFFEIFPVSCPTWGKAMKVQNNSIVACIPFAKSIAQINLSDYTYKKLPIYLDIADPKAKITYEKITFNGLEIAEEIFPFRGNDGFAIASKVIVNNKAKRLVRLYDTLGNTRGYLLDKHSEAFGGSISSISDVTPQTFTTFYAHRPEDKSVFPYALLTQRYHE